MRLMKRKINRWTDKVCDRRPKSAKRSSFNRLAGAPRGLGARAVVGRMQAKENPDQPMGRSGVVVIG